MGPSFPTLRASATGGEEVVYQQEQQASCLHPGAIIFKPSVAVINAQPGSWASRRKPSECPSLVVRSGGSSMVATTLCNPHSQRGERRQQWLPWRLPLGSLHVDLGKHLCFLLVGGFSAAALGNKAMSSIPTTSLTRSREVELLSVG